jgi:hypothetical protein
MRVWYGRNHNLQLLPLNFASGDYPGVEISVWLTMSLWMNKIVRVRGYFQMANPITASESEVVHYKDWPNSQGVWKPNQVSNNRSLIYVVWRIIWRTRSCRTWNRGFNTCFCSWNTFQDGPRNSQYRGWKWETLSSQSLVRQSCSSPSISDPSSTGTWSKCASDV